MDSKTNLENLQRSGGLKAEPPDRKECDGLMRSARDRLKDAARHSYRLPVVLTWLTTPPTPWP